MSRERWTSVVSDPAGSPIRWYGSIPRIRSLALSDRKSTRLNSSHSQISYAVFCLKKKNTRVLDAVCSTHRHDYVSPDLRPHAYYDKSLPIGRSQTISIPYIVAVVTQDVDRQPHEK